MTGLLREERERTQSSWEAARRDSRLGYEWEQRYRGENSGSIG